MTQIERIANAFAGNMRDKDVDRSGWGQFITAARTDQIGLYGTCAGLICLGYAGRSDASQTFLKVRTYLDQIWQAPEKHDRKYFCQTTRLAFFVLAMEIFKDGCSSHVRAEAIRDLKQRRLANGLWPAWHLVPHPNQKSSIVATSLALLALKDEAKTDTALQSQLLDSAKQLAAQLPPPGSGRTSPLLPLCAIASVMPFNRIPKITRSLMRQEIQRQHGTADIEFDFVDYGIDNNGSLSHGRDYFYVPVAALQLYLASQLSRHWVVAFQAAERLDVLLNTAIGQNGFQRENSDFVASLDQAWICWALVAAGEKKRPLAYSVRSFCYGALISPGPFLLRDFIIPLIIGSAAALAGQNPSLLTTPACYFSKNFLALCVAPEAELSKINDTIQSIGITTGFVFGSLFIWRISVYTKYFFERLSR